VPAAHDVGDGAMNGGVVDAATAAATAREAAAAEAAEVLDELRRVSSELSGDVALEQAALQLVLCIAARAGAEQLVVMALALGGDPAPRPSKKMRGSSVVNERGLPPLHIAARAGHATVVRLLLDASAPPTLLSGAGMPPLVLAAQTDDSLPAFGLLLAAGAPLAMRDDRRQTALHTAARTGSVGVLKLLLRAGDAEDTRKRADAAALGVTNLREPFIELRDHWQRTALHWAVVNQQEAALTLLIEAGASVNGVPMPTRKHKKSTSLPRETPLHSAARLPPNAATSLLCRLLAASADPNRTDEFGQTPLHLAAAASGQERCAACSARASARADDGDAAAAVRALLDGGADATRCDATGRTPRLLAEHLAMQPSHLAAPAADAGALALIAAAENRSGRP
jgi:ankyrin repeat protein